MLKTDRKQNKGNLFQIINLLFSGHNSATFDVKVAEFSIKNKRFFNDNLPMTDIKLSGERNRRQLHAYT